MPCLQFDKDLEAQTQKRLDEIRAEAEAKMVQILEEQREKNRSTIDNLRKESDDIVSRTAKAIRKPVTAKIRKGFDDACINAVEIARVIEEAGGAAVAMDYTYMCIRM